MSTPKTQSKDCPICCDTFTKSTRAKVTCCNSDCQFEACKQCTRTYLLNSSADPHCMQCKIGWGHEFLIINLNNEYLE